MIIIRKKVLVDLALNDICNAVDFTKLFSKVFCVLADYGLLTKAKEEICIKKNNLASMQAKPELLGSLSLLENTFFAPIRAKISGASAFNKLLKGY